MRWTRRLAHALIVLAVVAGPPVAVGWWLAHHNLNGLAQLRTWREQPLTPATVVAAVLAVAAMGWLTFALVVLRQTGRRLRARWTRLRQMSIPGPAQVTATSMAGLAAFTVPAPDTGAAGIPPVADSGRLPPAAGAGQPHDSGDTQPASSAGIALPGGGWIPERTAVVVAAVAAAVWWQRRRAYRPGPPRSSSHLDDPDLQPLPQTADTVIAALNDPPAAVTPPQGMPQLLDDFPDRLRLSGPGAYAAARGVLVSAALHATSGRRPPRRIAISRDDLRLLLPDHDPASLAAYGIDVTDAPPDGAGRKNGSERPEQARTVLVIVGGEAAGEGWTVATDGHVVADGVNARMCVLEQHAARELLTLIDQVRPGDFAAALSAPPIMAPAATAGPSPGHLALLGSCQLSVNGQPVALRRTAGRQVLAYLAVHTVGATSAELTRAIWPGLPSESITGRLYTTLSELKRQLHPLLGGDPVDRRDDRYLLNTRVIGSDLAAVRDAIAMAARATTVDECRAAAAAVSAAYRGELAAGHVWPWIHPLREALRREVIDAFLALGARGDSADSNAFLAAALNIDPHNLELRRRLERSQRVAPAPGHERREAPDAKMIVRPSQHRTGNGGADCSSELGEGE
ncbi:hypothetical protein OWR29_38920 [Actinoplanes sp. Pm04-4]|uniref:Transcriptional regulator n=1 Tax=Paractinoplanes pyxinae TaxID=2997416 RepID=A0ABT4BBV8_9ACTN|nr:hypothetical protein [Actinoplanes pyxinae]MCY1144003.1 hypothetical protein [Actinoplanes pyxinae]